MADLARVSEPGRCLYIHQKGNDMTNDERNFQARLAYAEQIGEARGAIGVALIFLESSDPVSRERGMQVLRDAEQNLLHLRHEPKTAPYSPLSIEGGLTNE